MQQQPPPQQHAAEDSGDVEEARRNALEQVADFRSIVATLEVTRLTRSRVGTRRWLDSSENLFGRQHALRIYPLITQAHTLIDGIFRDAAASSRGLFDRVTEQINGAESKTQISEQLQIMETAMIQNTERRRRAAVGIMQIFTNRLNELPGHSAIDDQWYNALYRMISAIEADGNYYPGSIVMGPDERQYIFGSVELPILNLILEVVGVVPPGFFINGMAPPTWRPG